MGRPSNPTVKHRAEGKYIKHWNRVDRKYKIAKAREAKILKEIEQHKKKRPNARFL